MKRTSAIAVIWGDDRGTDMTRSGRAGFLYQKGWSLRRFLNAKKTIQEIYS